MGYEREEGEGLADPPISEGDAGSDEKPAGSDEKPANPPIGEWPSSPDEGPADPGASAAGAAWVYGPQPEPDPGAQPQRKPPKRGRVQRIIAVAALMIGVVLGQFLTDQGIFDVFGRLPHATQAGETSSASEIASRVAEVARLMDSSAYYDVDADAATEGTISALFAATADEHAEYYDSDYFASYLEYLSGSYTGFGITIATYGNCLMVTYVYEGSPAQEAGVQAGDVLVSIDGQEGPWDMDKFDAATIKDDGQTCDFVWLRPSTESLEDLIEALDGASASGGSGDAADEGSDGSDGSEGSDSSDGSDVDAFSILEGDLVEITMGRGEFSIDGAEAEMIGSVGYVSLSMFSANSGEELRSAVSDLMSQGASSIILDLRGNGGGYSDQAIDVVSMFVGEGTVMQVKSGDGDLLEQTVNGDVICDLPMAVLVDSNTASSSEIVASALQDHGRATIVGTLTYGNGSIQRIQPLTFGGAVKFTIGEYLSPNGNEINHVGVEPDIWVDDAEGSEHGAVGNDPQLDAAIEALGQAGE